MALNLTLPSYTKTETDLLVQSSLLPYRQAATQDQLDASKASVASVYSKAETDAAITAAVADVATSSAASAAAVNLALADKAGREYVDAMLQQKASQADFAVTEAAVQNLATQVALRATADSVQDAVAALGDRIAEKASAANVFSQVESSNLVTAAVGALEGQVYKKDVVDGLLTAKASSADLAQMASTVIEGLNAKASGSELNTAVTMLSSRIDALGGGTNLTELASRVASSRVPSPPAARCGRTAQ